MTAYNRSKTDIIRRLRRGMERALTDNPEIKGLYAPDGVAPTVVNNNVEDTTLTQSLNMVDNYSQFRGTGGQLYGGPGSAGTKRGFIATNNLSPATGNLPGIFTGPSTPPLKNNGENVVSCATLWLMTDAPKIQFRIPGSAGYFQRIIVDGQYLTRAGWDTSTNNFVSVDFGSRKPRMIGIDVNSLTQFNGFRVDALSRVWKPSLPNDLVAYFTGDSHLQGAVAGTPSLAVHLIGKYCGIADCRNVAVGGTGYIATNGGTRSKIRDQMDNWLGNGPMDLIGIAGGFNDVVTNAFDVATVADEALLSWQKARAAQPNALIAIFGVWAANSGPSANVIALENALAARFAAWADNFAVFIPISTASQPWMYGTGNTSAPAGNGNSDLYTNGADLPHANMLGQGYNGQRMIEALRGAIFGLAA